MWSEKQQQLFLIAAKHAGWEGNARYVAMRACGCPCAKAATGRGQSIDVVNRPSIKNPANTHEQFAAAMMLAESCAATRGVANFPRPGGPSGGRSWADAAADTGTRLRHKAEQIWAEAQARMPGRFFGGKPALDTIVRDRVCKHDQEHFPDLFGTSATTLEECDAAQLCRVIELLRNYVGREFYKAGLPPRSFTIPGAAIAQCNAEARRHVAQRQAEFAEAFTAEPTHPSSSVEPPFTTPEVFA